MNKRLHTAAALIAAATALAALNSAQAADDILHFTTMVGVDGGFVDHKIRGVLGDELPWEIASATGSLTKDGHLLISIRGLVFPDEPPVPPKLRGINDEPEFRALVSCLSDEGQANTGSVTPVNIPTVGFPATRKGNATIDTRITLPHYCVAPIIFILAGSEDHWFAMTGAEIGED